MESTDWLKSDSLDFIQETNSSTLKVFEKTSTGSNGALGAVIFVETVHTVREESETLDQFEVLG